MIDDDLLHRLRDARGAAVPRPMPEIARRAAALRTRRRIGRAGTAVVLAGLLGAIGVPVWVHQDRALTGPAGVHDKAATDAAGGKPCTFEPVSVRFSHHPELTYLPSPQLVRRVTGFPPTTSRLLSTCSNPLAPGVWYSTDPTGTVSKRLAVSGPDAPKPVTQGLDPEYTPVPVNLDGRKGLISYRATPASRDRRS